MADYQQQNQRRSLWGATNSMPIITEATPLSTRVSSIQPQYSYDERRMLPYRESKQAWSPDNLILNSSAGAKQGIRSTKNFVTMLIVGTLISVVACGVPLAVITALYVQAKSTNTTSGTSNTASSTTLPSQCSSYTTISDATRNVGYSSSFSSCDSSLTAGWYRFVSPAGTQLATSAVNSGYCGANYGTWFNGSLPTTVGGMSGGFACSYYSGSHEEPKVVTL
ncbi:unnamed protein product [Rotaria sp. Silwood1]|nr:unnamed protein product [Rotaria sp. Silwood1]